MMKNLLVVLAMLVGCAPAPAERHFWEPGPDAADTFETAKAKCQLFTHDEMRGRRGLLSLAMGADQTIFNECMVASGWREQATCDQQWAQLLDALKPMVPSEQDKATFFTSCRSRPEQG